MSRYVSVRVPFVTDRQEDCTPPVRVPVLAGTALEPWHNMPLCPCRAMIDRKGGTVAQRPLNSLCGICGISRSIEYSSTARDGNDDSISRIRLSGILLGTNRRMPCFYFESCETVLSRLMFFLPQLSGANRVNGLHGGLTTGTRADTTVLKDNLPLLPAGDTAPVLSAGDDVCFESGCPSTG